MHTDNSKGIAWGSAAHFDRELAERLASTGKTILGPGEKKLRAAARRAGRAGSVEYFVDHGRLFVQLPREALRALRQAQDEAL